MIDPTKLKKDLPVIVRGDTHGTVRGVYLSPQGIVVRVNTRTGSIVDENVLIENVEEVKANEQSESGLPAGQ